MAGDGRPRRRGRRTAWASSCASTTARAGRAAAGPGSRPSTPCRCWSGRETAVRGPATVPGVPARSPTTRVGYYRDVAVLAFRTPPARQATTARCASRGIPGKPRSIRGDRHRAGRLPPRPPGAAIARGRDRRPHRAAGQRRPPGLGRAGGRLDDPAHRPHAAPARTNHPAPPEGRGLECDKLSREALDAHWAGMMAKVLQDAGPLAGKSAEQRADRQLRGRQPELDARVPRGVPEAPRLRPARRSCRWSPAAWSDSVEESERFLWDFRRTIARPVRGELLRLLRRAVPPARAEVLHRAVRQRLVRRPPGRRPGRHPDGRVLGRRRARWRPPSWPPRRRTPTAGRVRRRGVVHRGRRSEAAGWRTRTRIKALGDLIFCNGINRYIFHRYAHQPWLDL